jgi:hypothetical protein
VNAVRTGEEPAEPEVFVTIRAPGVVTYFATPGDLATAVGGDGGTVGHPLTAPVNGTHLHPGCPGCDGPGA